MDKAEYIKSLVAQGKSDEEIQELVSQKFPPAEVESEEPQEPNFQKDPAPAETNVGSENNTVSSSEDTLLELRAEVEKYDRLDNSKEAILARRKLAKFEQSAILSQPEELEEVVVTPTSLDDKLAENMINSGNADLLFAGGNVVERKKLLDALENSKDDESLHFLEKRYVDATNDRMIRDKMGPQGAPAGEGLIKFFGLMDDDGGNYNDNENMWKEVRNRSTASGFEGAPLLEMVSGAVRDPYIYRNDYYGQTPDGSTPLVLNFTGEKNEYSEKGYSKDINVSRLRSKAVNYFTGIEHKANIEKYGDQSKYTDFVLGQGDQFLTPKQLEYKKLKDEYTANPTEELKAKLEDFDYGDDLYDPFTGKVVSMENASEQVLELNDSAEELANTTELDKLNDGLSNAYSKLIGLSKAVNRYTTPETTEGEGDFVSLINTAPTDIRSGFAGSASRATNWLGDLFGDDENFSSDLKNIKSISETGVIPSNISTLPSSHPLAVEYNNAVKEYLTYNKAVKLNVDPLTTEKDGLFQGAWDRITQVTDTESIKAMSDDKTAETFVNAVQGSNLKFIDPKEVDERLNKSMSNSIGSGSVDLGLFVASILATKKATAGQTTKAFKALEKTLLKTKPLQNSRIKANATKNFLMKGLYKTPEAGIKLGLSGLDEAAIFGLSEVAVSRKSGTAARETLPFGFSLGVGNRIAGGIIKRAAGTGFFSPLSMRLAQYNTTNYVGQNALGAVTGSSVYHFALGVEEAKGFITQGDNYKSDFFDRNKIMADYLKDGMSEADAAIQTSKDFREKIMHSFLEETAKMSILNLTKAGGGGTIALGRGKGRTTPNWYYAAKEDIYRMKGKDLASTEAAKNLGIDHKLIDNSDKNFYKTLDKTQENKIKEIDNKVKKLEISEEEANNQKKKVNNDALTLANRYEILEFKKVIEAEQKNGNFGTRAEEYSLANKLLTGKELTSRENYLLSRTPIQQLMNVLGVKGKKLMNDPSVLLSIDQLQKKSHLFEEVMNGSEVKTKEGTKEREAVWEYLKKLDNTRAKVNELEGRENLTIKEKEQLKELKNQEKELSSGTEYKAILESVKKATETRYTEDISRTQSFLERTLGGKLQEVGTAKEFQDAYNTAFPASKTKVGEKLGFYDPNNKVFYVNKTKALNTNTITTGLHESLHFILRDSLKGEDGKISKEGIKVIDQVIEQLTPEQQALLKADVASRYDTTKPQSEWYEENLTSLSELISNNKIKFNENIGGGLTKFIPFLRKKGLENLEMGTETGLQMFNLIKSYAKGEAKGVEAAVKVSKTAEGAKPVDAKEGPKSENIKDLQTKINDLVAGSESKEAYFGKFNNLINERFGYDINAEGLRSAKLNPLIERYVVSRSSNAEQAKRNLAELKDRLMNFNPAEKRKDGSTVGSKGFVEFINSNVNFVKMVSDKALAIESQKKKQEKRITEDTKEIAATETRKTEKVEEAVDVVINPLKFTGVPKISIKTPASGQFNFKQITKDYAGQVGEQIFGVPANKIMKGGDNLGALVEARKIQQFFVKGNNINRLLRILPEFNVATNQAKIGEKTLEVSNAAKGISLNLNKRVLDYFYKDYVDPAGVMTSPGGRSKGKTSQVPVKRLKPEFRGKISTETLKKVRKDLGITEAGEANILPKGTERSSIGQLLKGVAKVQSQLTANAYVREQARKATDQQLADMAAGKRDAMFSESKVGKKEKIEKLAGGKIVGTENKTAAEVLTEGLNKIVDGIPEFGTTLNPSSISPSGKEFSTAFKRGQLLVSEGGKQKATLDAIKSGEVAVGSQFQQRAENNAGKSINEMKKASPNMATALKGQNKQDLARNLKTIDSHNKGNVELIEMFEKAFKIDPKATAYVLYNQNANNAVTRNMAQMRGVELGIDMSRVREEHMLQHGSFVELMIETFGLKGKAKKDAQKHLAENYYQIAIEGRREGNFKTSESIIDGIYTENRFTGEKAPTYRSKSELHPEYVKAWNKAKETGDFSKLPEPGVLRAYNEYSYLNPYKIGREGITDAQRYIGNIGSSLKNNPNMISKAAELIYKQQIGEITRKQAIAEAKAYEKLAPGETAAAKFSSSKFPKELGFKSENIKEVINFAKILDKAVANAKDPNKKPKGISVFDFDDTLAKTKSKVKYELPDGKSGVLSATEFAKKAEILEKKGASFDFSDFNKIVGGKKGPLFDLAQKREGKFTNKDIFILTARPQLAAGPIHMFLKSQGLNIPIENIKGLEDGTPMAKARWMLSKAAEGYNDFYFADDALKNVKAVKKVLDIVDVKSDVQLAEAKFSNPKQLSKDFNKILEQKTGIGADKTYSKAKAEVVGKGKGKFNIFIPASAEDFVGLLYRTLGKGKRGDAQLAWYNKHLMTPFAKAMNAISKEQMNIATDFKYITKQLGIVPKNLRKKIPGEGYSKEQAIRMYIWNKQGMEIPGASKRDVADMKKYIENNAELKLFAEKLIEINKGDGYVKPSETWLSGSIKTDLMEGVGTTKRTKHLVEWQRNADAVFTKENLNKLEAAFGSGYRESLENMLYRMKTGRNRNFGTDSVTGRFTDWLTSSIGTIMFFNTRSAILQTVSSLNYINFKDNNPLKAGLAFANQPQYWKDFNKLFNSDFLRARRAGLRINVNEADIAQMAKKNGVQGAINYILEKGFLPTQIADSFAIAAGGSTMYRNRVKTYVKQGFELKVAEEKALRDWREISEESQQSSRPDRISMQQAGPLGRIILAFANTPSQYARLMKRGIQDLAAGRGDAKTNMSKVLYYGFAQNLMFNAMQQAVFALSFDDEEENLDKGASVANGMVDSILRGMGIQGAMFAAAKNAVIRIATPGEDPDKAAYELSRVSPPISSKLSRVNQAVRSMKWDRDEMIDKGWSLDNPAYLAAANLISAGTNIPIDRAIKKTNNLVEAMNRDNEWWERLALLGGWQGWEIGLDEGEVQPSIYNGNNTPRKIQRKSGTERKRIKRK